MCVASGHVLTVELLIIGDELLERSSIEIVRGSADNFTKRHGGLVSANGADIVSDIVSAMRIAAQRSDVVVTSGGLGPCGRPNSTGSGYVLRRPLIETTRPSKTAQKAVGRVLKDADRKQAQHRRLPPSCPIVVCARFLIESDETHFFHLPGVRTIQSTFRTRHTTVHRITSIIPDSFQT